MNLTKGQGLVDTTILIGIKPYGNEGTIPLYEGPWGKNKKGLLNILPPWVPGLYRGIFRESLTCSVHCEIVFEILAADGGILPSLGEFLNLIDDKGL